MRNGQRVAGMLVLVTEFGVFALALFVAFLLTVWTEGDGFAARATEMDWWIEAGKRMTIAAIGATIFSILAFFVSRLALRWVGVANERVAILTAASAFVLLLSAAAVGAIAFVITKPLPLGAPALAAENVRKYPACNITKTKNIYFRNYTETDVLFASIEGAPCYEAKLKITIKTRQGQTIYHYEAPFKPHIAVHWEHLEVPKDPQNFLDRLFKEGLKRSQDLPAFVSEKDFEDDYNNQLKVDPNLYEQIRRARRPIFWHLTQYEEWRYVSYDDKTTKGIVIASGGL